MKFRLLGPFEVEADHGLVEMRRRRERCLLAILLRHNHTAFSADRLEYLLWDGEPAPSSRQQLYSHVSRLRAMLRGSQVELSSVGPMYRLDVDDDAIDASRFQRMVAEARTAGDPADRGRQLRRALDLWRGEALDGTVSEWLRPRLVADLDELRLAATEEWFESGMATGDHVRLLPELTRLAAAHPARERIAALSMRALHLAGRSVEALDVYRHHQRTLADEVGLDPSKALQALHLAILRGEVEPARPGPTVVPAQLPANVPGFSGRASELDRLDTVLNADERARAVVVSALSGTAGIGKTALAVHWAHRVADRFPDGQLYVNLRGFHPGQAPLAAAEAVRGFLDALGVPTHRIPIGLDAQAGLYRSLLAGRRVLVVLDNARDADQVRPLLPGSPGCLVLVTSRNQLTGLVAAEGAQPLTLDLLTARESRLLLAGRLGAHRVAAEPKAVDEIIAVCAQLPLALVIVAAHAAMQPTLALEALAGQLREAPGSLDPFAGDDPATDVRTVFSWSYRNLSDLAARLFRLLGTHPGPDITAPAAASLAGIPLARVEPPLTELTRAHLVAEHGPGRYTFHDLLRAYAIEQARAHDSDQERSAALHRVLDHYLHTAHTAARLLYPQRDLITPNPPAPGVTPEDLTDYNTALTWFTAEHPVLLATLHHAAGTGFDTHTWQLAWTLATFLDRRGHWNDWAATQRAALDAARRLGDRAAQAHSHRHLARAYARLGRYDDAYADYLYALDLHSELGDATGQADTHLNLAMVFERQRQHREALRHVRKALELFQTSGDLAGQARALNNVGWLLAQLGDYEEALAHCRRGLALHKEVGNRYGEAITWDSLGYAHHHLGHHAQAIECYQSALELHVELGERLGKAMTLSDLGEAHRGAGDPEAARAAWQEALVILEELDHPDAGQLRAKMANVPESIRG